MERDNIAYIKDVDNVWDDYLRTWQGACDNLSYRVYILKITIVFNESFNYW